MNTKLSVRTKKYMEISDSIEFSKEEMLVLGNLLDIEWSSSISKMDFDTSFFIAEAIHECVKDGYCSDTYNVNETDGDGMTSNTRSVPLTFMQYLLVNFKRVFFFIVLVPISRVPLYINDPTLALFARWRLTIAK